MSRYLRFGYLVPRLVLLVAIVCVAEFGSGWLLRRAIVDGGQQALGARVEVGQANVSLLGARAEVTGLVVANPQRPMTNLLEADRVELDFEADSLLRKRAIAERGVVRGLRFGTPRETSGALDPADAEAAAEAPAWLADRVSRRANEAADAWLAGVEDNLNAEYEDLESVRLAASLREEWPDRYERLRAEAEAIREEIDTFRTTASEARENPLRHADFLAQAPSRLATLQQRIEDVAAEAAALPTRVAEDRQRVEAARLADEARLRERLQVDQLDPQSLTSYLIGEQVTGPTRELLGWVRWAREMIPPSEPITRTVPRDRGVDVRFLGVRQRPELLIRSLELGGAASLAGRPVELDGVVTDFTTSPALHAVPMRIELQTAGAMPMKVRGVIDRVGATPVDEFLVTCPTLELPPGTVGEAGKLAFAMAPSTASLSVSLRVEGEQLAGEVQIVQQGVRLEPRVGPEASAATERLARLVAPGVASLPKAATRVSLGGTLDQPELSVWSTYGPAMAESLESSARRLVESEAERGVERVRERVNAELGDLDRVLADARSDLDAELSGPLAEAKRLAAAWAGTPLGTGSKAFEQLGERVPAIRSLFR